MPCSCFPFKRAAKPNPQTGDDNQKNVKAPAQKVEAPATNKDVTQPQTHAQDGQGIPTLPRPVPGPDARPEQSVAHSNGTVPNGKNSPESPRQVGPQQQKHIEVGSNNHAGTTPRLLQLDSDQTSGAEPLNEKEAILAGPADVTTDNLALDSDVLRWLGVDEPPADPRPEAEGPSTAEQYRAAAGWLGVDYEIVVPPQAGLRWLGADDWVAADTNNIKHHEYHAAASWLGVDLDLDPVVLRWLNNVQDSWAADEAAPTATDHSAAARWLGVDDAIEEAGLRWLDSGDCRPTAGEYRAAGGWLGVDNDTEAPTSVLRWFGDDDDVNAPATDKRPAAEGATTADPYRAVAGWLGVDDESAVPPEGLRWLCVEAGRPEEQGTPTAEDYRGAARWLGVDDDIVMPPAGLRWLDVPDRPAADMEGSPTANDSDSSHTAVARWLPGDVME